MTTEYGNSDAPRAAERRGLSRRQMIKASAVAGAAAWTAPIIIDSLSSPAAAGSKCVPYWVKVLASSTVRCYSACPGDATMFPLNDQGANGNYRAHWAGNGLCQPTGSGGDPGCNDLSPSADRMPATVALDGDYWKVTLNSDCFFQTAISPNTKDWQIGGRYNTSYLKATDTGSSAPASGNGCYTDGGTTGWIAKTDPPNKTTDKIDIDYIYLKFCCNS
jgi:hypothetical protein